MSTMKILHVCPLYFPSVGGNQKHVQLFSEGMAELGHEVSVLTANARTLPELREPPGPGEAMPARTVIRGVNVYRLPVNYGLYRFLFRKMICLPGGFRFLTKLLKEKKTFCQNGPLVRGFFRAVRGIGPDIMTVFTDYALTTYLGYQAAGRLTIPWAIAPITHMSEEWIHRPVLLKLFSKADAVIACTDFERRHLISKGVASQRVHVVPLGLNPSFPEHTPEGSAARISPEPGPVVAYIGRKVKGKGIDALIRAMPAVWKRCPEARLLLAGQSSEYYERTLRPMIEELPPDRRSRVVEVDDFDEKDKASLFRMSDVIVMPSSVDSFGFVYLEAWLCGRPVIACRGYPQETIIDDGRDGLLVGYNDAAGLAEAVNRLLADPALREQMGALGKEKVRTGLNLQASIQKMIGLYEDMMARYRGSLRKDTQIS